jgi:hypothetical protein
MRSPCSPGVYLSALNFRIPDLLSMKSDMYIMAPEPISTATSVASHCFEVEVNFRPTVSRSVCLGVGHPSGTRDQFFFPLEIVFRQLGTVVAPSLTRRRVCNLLYNCFCTLQDQSLLCRGPAELTVIFYCPIWDPQLGWPGPRIYIPQEEGGPVILPGTWFPFYRLLRLAGRRWMYSIPPPHGSQTVFSMCISLYCC